MMDYSKKGYKIAVFALVLALLAFSVGGNITTNSTIVNQTVGLNIVVNNTNLAPTIEPSVPGTGERITGTTYFNNNSDIEIFLYSHASAANQTSDIQLLINGTMVSSVSSKPVGGVEQNNKSIVAVIPRYSSYKAIFLNYHHYEWREYQVLSGEALDNDTAYVNKTGDTWTGNMNVDGYGIITPKSHVHLESSPIPLVRLGVESAYSSYLEVFQESFNLTLTTAGPSIFYTLNKSGLDMQNKNIFNCANCVNQTQLNEKVNKSGDTWTGVMRSNFSQTTNSIDIVGGASIFDSLNTTTGYSSTVHLEPNNLYIQVTNGTNNAMLMDENKTTFQKEINMSSNNITNSGTINFSVGKNIQFSSDAEYIVLNETGSTAASANESGYLTWASFIPDQNATITRLGLNIASFGTNSSYRMAIYNDNGSNAPTTLLSESLSIPITYTGWNNADISSVVVNSSSRYWIAFQTLNAVTSYYNSVGTSFGKYKASSYGAFPTSAGSTLPSVAFNMRAYIYGGNIRTFCLRSTYEGQLYTVLC